jgi:hypothetical protein
MARTIDLRAAIVGAAHDAIAKLDNGGNEDATLAWLAERVTNIREQAERVRRYNRERKQ